MNTEQKLEKAVELLTEIERDGDAYFSCIELTKVDGDEWMEKVSDFLKEIK